MQGQFFVPAHARFNAEHIELSNGLVQVSGILVEFMLVKLFYGLHDPLL
jgi:hypothetical protein